MAKEVLVVLGENKKKVCFSGSTLQDLFEAIKEKFKDVLASEISISHLQMWDKDYDEYVDLEDVSTIRNKSKIKCVLKEESRGIDGSANQSQDMYKPLVPYCTEPLGEELTVDTGDNDSRNGQEGSAAYVLESKLWVGRNRLSVYFLNPKVLKDEGWMCGKGQLNTSNILGWAAAWKTAHCPAIPDFQQTDRQEEADIRVKFQGGACWSKVGRSAKLVIDESEPTMVLSLKGISENEQRFLVIHEFGHALGLLHEHQRHDFWNVASAVLDVNKMKEDPRMKKVKFDRDILPLQLSGVTTKYDPESVMHYWFDVSWLKNVEHRDLAKVESDENLTEEQKEILRGIHKRNNSNAPCPSGTDLNFLQQLYGNKSPEVPPAAAAPSNDETPDLHIKLTSEHHFNTLLEAAYSARNAWENIGSDLGIPPHDLKAIKKNHRGDVEDCFREMLTQWFQACSNCYLDTFVKALRNEVTVKQGNLVEKVKEAILKVEQGHNNQGSQQLAGRKRSAGSFGVEFDQKRHKHS